MHFFFRLLMCLLACIAVNSFAQSTFPDHPITIRVAYPAGGSTDREIRVLAQLVSKELGQPLIVENHSGASGTLAASGIIRMAPDGYTLAHAPITIFRMPYMQQTSWDPLRDFTYVAGLSGYMLGIGVRADSNFKTWQDVADFAHKNPGVITYASVGVGSSQHLGMAELERQTGLKFNHIPYKGGAETAKALLAGEVVLNADAISTLTSLGDKARILMLWSPERSPALPGVPTARELGIDLVMESPYGLVGPKGMPNEIVQTLSKAFAKALNDPSHLELLNSIQQTVWHRTPEEYAAYAHKAFEEEHTLLKNVGLAN